MTGGFEDELEVTGGFEDELDLEVALEETGEGDELRDVTVDRLLEDADIGNGATKWGKEHEERPGSTSFCFYDLGRRPRPPLPVHMRQRQELFSSR